MLDVFRRNQRVAVAVLGVVAMLSFVILPLVTQYFQSQSTAARGDVQQIRLAGRPLERDALARFQRNHSLTVQFLERIAMLVLSRNGAPKVPGFAADARGFRLGIETPDERNLETYAIRTFLLNEEARRMGLELDDQSVEEWLNLYFDNNVTQKEVADLLRELAQSQFGKNQLYSQLKLELQADLVMRAANLGLAGRSYNFPGGPITITPPAAAWKNYLKLNENATVAVYPFLVDDYIAETPETFPENEIAATFGKYKDRLAFSDSPEPGFRRRFASDLEVVTASFDDFFEKAKAEVTEEQLKAEYEKRVAEGRFDVKETTPPANTPPAETPPADKPAETTPPAEKPADMPAEKPADMPAEKPAETPPAEKPAETPPADKPAETPPAEKPAETPPAEKPAETPAAEKPAETPPAEKPAETPPAEKPAETPPANPQSSNQSGASVRLVALQDTPAGDQPPAPAGDKPEAPAAETKPETPPAAEATPPAATPPAATPPAAGEQPAATAPAAEGTPAAPAETTPTRRLTFEETRAQILDGLARPIATAKQQAALSKVHEVMSKHFLAQNAYQSQVKAGKKVEAPETPDIKKLAEELGLKYSRTGFIDVLSSQGMPIAQSSAGEIFAQGQSFFSIAFTDKTPLLYPQQTSNFFAGESYVFWKLEERQAYVPTLAEARDEVVATLRRQKARELAKEAADKFRRDAAGSDKPMVELVPETRRNLVQEKVGPFTWMQSFNMRQAPNVSNLPSLDRAGEEFMKNVFATASGQYAVAPNETESVFYVVKVLERKPDEATLRQAFMNATSRLPTQPLTESEYLNLRSSWLSDLEDRYGLKLVE